MRTIPRFGLLFLVASLLAFVVLAPRPASSSSRNVAGSGCQVFSNPSGGVDYQCPIVVQDGQQTNSITTSTYDFFCLANHQATYGMFKRTITGSLYSDLASFVCGSSGSNQTKFVAAANVRQNASSTDYLWHSVLNVSTVYGVQAAFFP